MVYFGVVVLVYSGLVLAASAVETILVSYLFCP